MNKNAIRLLIASNDEKNVKTIRKSLESFGIDIEYTLSGNEAIKICEIKDFDILFIDRGLNDLNGVEVIKKIRDNGKNEDTIAVALISTEILSVKELCIDAGFDEILVKPLDSVQINSIISEMLTFEVNDSGNSEKIKELENSIPDLNVSDAIEKYSGTFEFYLDMLSDVAGTSRIDKMEAALCNGDYAEYRLNAHTLKGMTRSVGLYSLANSFEALQKSCDSGDYDYVFENNKKIMDSFRTAIEKINEYLCKNQTLDAL